MNKEKFTRAGLEPVTSRLTCQCSTKLSHISLERLWFIQLKTIKQKLNV